MKIIEVSPWFPVETVSIATLMKNFRPEKSISVIITNWKRTQWLPSVLDSIYDQHFPDNMLEIIIVDDNSEDDIVETVSEFADRTEHDNLRLYLTHKNITYNITLAANIGIKRATKDLVIINPSDCWQIGKYLSFASTFFTARADLRHALSGFILSELLPRTPLISNYLPITDVGLITQRENLVKIHGFDQRFRGWGSSAPDLINRLYKSGVVCANTLDLVMLTKIYLPNGIVRPPEMELGANNPAIDDENGRTNLIVANGNDWGELDTLECIF